MQDRYHRAVGAPCAAIAAGYSGYELTQRARHRAGALAIIDATIPLAEKTMKRGKFPLTILMALAMTAASFASSAGPIRDRLMERRQQPGSDADDLDGSANAMSCAEWAQKVNRLQRFAGSRNAGPAPDVKDVAYGAENLDRLDVFFARKSASSAPAPVIMMVHGGGWCVGDKAAASVTANKVARWTPKGFLFISVNYPMVNDGDDALAQANHIARAVAFVQANAGRWGGDPSRIVLMGHSAGAHLVSLVNADAQIRQANGVRQVLGTVSLDAGAIDVVKQMPRVYPFLKARYRDAFGTTEAEWVRASPFHTLDRTAAPWLGVCSTQRKDDPCSQAQAYADKSNGLGVRAAVLPEHKNHGSIDRELGTPGDYTADVEAFMASLDPVVAGLLR
jgi:arylformamidase